MKSNFTTHTGIFFLKIMAKFPFVFIYFLSDIFYVVVFYLIRYRKQVVFENLKYSFPEKSSEEIIAISKKYYRHFCDITLETIKMANMKSSDYYERFKIRNPQTLNVYFEKGKSVILLSMHHNNWEWTTSLPLHLKHKILAVYKPLHNNAFDAFLNNIRSRHGFEMVQNSTILRRLIHARDSNEPVITWLAGDQTPPHFHKFWTKFLNQEAMFYPGPATLSKQFNHPVFFQKTIKKARGRYVTEFELLFENPNEVTDAEIIKKYIQKMEEVIRENPEYYIWSHRRWKHKRPAGVSLIE
jgi:Kdo2-lipid IVA lauroyltransferase/acyltransferase